MEIGKFYLPVVQKRIYKQDDPVIVTENIDFIDLKQGVHLAHTSESQSMGESHTFYLAMELGYTKSAITQAEHIYFLSERGYDFRCEIYSQQKSMYQMKKCNY